MEGISIAKLLIIVALIMLLFGAKKLRTLGSDVGAAIKGFKNAVNEDDTAAEIKTSATEHPSHKK